MAANGGADGHFWHRRWSCYRAVGACRRNGRRTRCVYLLEGSLPGDAPRPIRGARGFAMG